MEQSVRHFPEEKRDEAEQWLLGLAPDLARDAGLRELADSVLKHTGRVPTDPERAFRLSSQIEDPAIHAEWVEKSLRELNGSNPARTLELISESGLPAELKTSLRESALRSIEMRERMFKKKR